MTNKAYARTLVATAINLTCFLRSSLYKLTTGHGAIAEEILGFLIEHADNVTAGYWETIDTRYLEILEDCTVPYKHGQSFDMGHALISFTSGQDETDRYVFKVKLELGLPPDVSLIQAGKA